MKLRDLLDPGEQMGFGVIDNIADRLKADSSGSKVGCNHCPLNHVPHLQKIMGHITGKRLLVWAQSPGLDENRAGRELVGRSGRWLWKEFGSVGLQREDCDIQNVVRCAPVNVEAGSLQLRDPSKLELKCCSVHTQNAIAQSQARIWAVFGRVATEQLFGKKKQPTMFYHRGTIKVYQFDHPSYFVRGTASADRLKTFRYNLGLLAKDVHARELPSRWACMEKQNYKLVQTQAEAIAAVPQILATYKRAAGRVVVYDVEDDVIDGVRKMLCVGACPEPGNSWVFLLDHPMNTVSTADRTGVQSAIVKLLQHQHEKAMHHGSYDVQKCQELLHAKVVGFNCDTQYLAFIGDPRHRSYSLSNVVERVVPEFVGYKDIAQAAVPAGLSVEDGRDIGQFHLAWLPLDKLMLYNGADCDVTQRIYQHYSQGVPMPLVAIYTHAAFVVDKMQQFGPLLDVAYTQQLAEYYPRKQEHFKHALQMLAGDPNLNPNSPDQLCRLLYEKLHIVSVNESLDTQKETLQLIQYRKPHRAIKLLQEYREAKNQSERIAAFQRSAEAHAGRVTTFWWMTGASTGRLSSGGGTRRDKRNFTNLQNIRRDDVIRNMLVSDLRWREFIKAAKTNLVAAVRRFADLAIFVSLDYAQHELRVLAQMSNDQRMIEVFCQGRDIHAEIGSLWTGWSAEEINSSEEKRSFVKNLHFGVVYGLTDEGLHADLAEKGIRWSLAVVKKMYKQYFDNLSAVHTFIQRQREFGREHGYVENLFGFRFPLQINEAKKGGYWGNQAINAPIQGAAHQILLMAFALLHRYSERYPDVMPQMEIHDQCVFVTSLKRLVPTLEQVRQLLDKDAPALAEKEFNFRWKVPFVAEAKIGLRFGGLVKVTGNLVQTLQAVVDKTGEQEKHVDKLLQQFN